MAIVTDLYIDGSYWIEINTGTVNDRHFIDKGYCIPKEKGSRGRNRSTKEKLMVRVEDLPKGSNIKLTKICDLCPPEEKDKTKTLASYYSILKQRGSEGGANKDKCLSCGQKSRRDKERKMLDICDCLWTTRPEIAKLLWNHSDGYLYKANSNKKVDFKCPNCGNKIKSKMINNIANRGVYGLSCDKCSDGISYPEKFFSTMLSQIDCEYFTQKTFSWTKVRIDGTDKYGVKRYDVYIPKINTVIELHGGQHYSDRFNVKIKEDDLLKKKLAIENGLRYISIDCSRSEKDFIKMNIMKSELISLIDLSDINWVACHLQACKSSVVYACTLWNNGLSVKEISKLIELEETTVRRYLKRGVEAELCNYNPKIITQEQKKSVAQLSKEGIIISHFSSMSEAEKLTGISVSKISDVCAGKRQTAGGFIWMLDRTNNLTNK